MAHFSKRKSSSEDGEGGDKTFKEFDCPSCNANNPVDPPFTEGDEILCHYCGAQYQVRLSGEARLKLIEI